MLDLLPALDLLRARLNIQSKLKDDFLLLLLEGAKENLKTLYGFEYDFTKRQHLLHLVYYAEYMYTHEGEKNPPKFLRHFFLGERGSQSEGN